MFYAPELLEFVTTLNPFVLIASGVVVITTSLILYGSVSSKDVARNGSDFNDISSSLKILANKDSALSKDKVESCISDYNDLFSGARSGETTDELSINHRKDEYAKMVDSFYHLVTDFYEWGWGQSFHFGPRWQGESFMESIKRAEYHLASSLGLKPGMRALDVGCGVGGPMRNIASFSGASVEGITINEYQVKVGNRYNENAGLAGICHLTQGDFQNLPFEERTFDRAFAIEATCHSPNRVTTFSNVNKVLKDDGLFTGYEWVVTSNYDPTNPTHVRIKEGIEIGNGLPTLVDHNEIVRCLEDSGFEVIDHYDANRGVHDKNQVPWYATLNGSMSITGFRMTYLGRCCTHALITVLETLRLAPKGSTEVSRLLNETAIDLCEGGKLEIFTPSYFFLARKVQHMG
jgi:sterol 24-C-methyltransferase